MSKIKKLYEVLKLKNPKKIYLFKIGIFYNIFNEDAKLVSSLLKLKLTNLSSDMIKCGFPTIKIEKYKHILEANNLDYEIIDNIDPVSNYYYIIQKIKKIDLNNTSLIEAFNLLYELQQKIKNN